MGQQHLWTWPRILSAVGLEYVHPKALHNIYNDLPISLLQI